MQWVCSLLKCQNSYEFIHNLKNSNNKHGSVLAKASLFAQVTQVLTYERTHYSEG